MVESSGSQGGARIPACSSSRWKRKPLQRNIRLHVSGIWTMDFIDSMDGGKERGLPARVRPVRKDP
jgi:hypothetical protein